MSQSADRAMITEWPLPRIVAVGREIHRHDQAAQVATRAMLDHFNGTKPDDTAGWIITPDGNDLTVRFLRRVPSGEVVAGWDVSVANGVAGPVVTVGSLTRLSAEDQAMERARRTAVASVPSPPCSASMNTVVLQDPTSDEWLVWLLSPPRGPSSVPVGQHYRMRVSADGGTLLSSEALTRSCLMLDRTQVPNGAAPVALTVTHLVSATPVETHVFQSLRTGVPIYVGAGGRAWRVDGARIDEIDPQSR